MLRSRRRGRLLVGCATLAAVCAAAGAVHAAAPADNPFVVKEVNFQGRTVQFAGAPAHGLTRWFRFGPWQYGARSRDSKPSDKNPNLYIVAPGTQYHSDTEPQFDHTAVINGLAKQDAAEWDVYWAVVLDPEFTGELRDEREILLQAQNLFETSNTLDLRDIPGREVLIHNLKVSSVADLDKYRREGRLPRLIIVRAGFSVRGTVTDPADATSASAKK